MTNHPSWLPTSAEDESTVLARLSKTPAEAYERGFMDGAFKERERLGWRPIVSVPRDGSRVLLYDAKRPRKTMIGQWRYGAWWGDTTNSGRAIVWNDDATHWMPVPEDPPFTKPAKANHA